MAQTNKNITKIVGRGSDLNIADVVDVAGTYMGLAVFILDGSGNPITSFGGGTQYVDAAAAATHPTGTGIIFNNAGVYNFVSTAQPLPVTGSLTVGGTIDNSTFTAGTTTGTPTMGFYHSTIDTVTDAHSAVFGMTSKRAMFVNLQNASGIEIGTPGAPIQVTLANTGTNATPVKVDGSAVTQPVSGTVTANLAAGSNVIGHVIVDTTSTTAVTGGPISVTTIVPGTGNTNLGAATAGAIGASKVGVVALFARQDTLSTLAGASGTYSEAKIDSVGSTWAHISAIDVPVNTILTPSASSTALTQFRNAALSNTATAVKISAGRLHNYHIYNPNSVDSFIQFYDAATVSVTVGTTAPNTTLWIPAGGALDGGFPAPKAFATAITVAATTTITGGTGPSTGLLVNFDYI